MSQQRREFAGCRILIVEDEPLIAVELRRVFGDAGASTIVASDADEALRMADVPALSAALVDINLGDDDCSAVCERLSFRTVPFVFYTADVRADILLRWPEVPVLTKLAGKDRILAVVESVLR